MANVYVDTEIRPFKNQVYDDLKQRHNKYNLFEDPEFPASNESLYRHNPNGLYGVEWKRPREVMDDAEFVVDGFDRCDMDQGYIGNCWFIAGCVGIMQNKYLFAKVVPENQSFSGYDYAGIFHFRFWLYGEWVDVVVDDRLPFWPDGRLVFCSNKQEPNEFWCSLLEKAYAKLYGNYENLEAGQTYDALIDMSGGIQEQLDLTVMRYSAKDELWNILRLSFEQESILGCSINPDPNIREAKLYNGLVKGHAFTITKIHLLDMRYKTVRLIRLRNPWGNEVEWNGAWSDNSSEWSYVRENDLDDIELNKEADGEFWMSYDDFVRNFDVVQICHLTANSYSSELIDNKIVSDHDWKCDIYHSQWVSPYTSGGSGHPDKSKYWTNPQFLVKLVDYGHYEDDDSCGMLISLMQKDSRLNRLYTSSMSAEKFIQFRLYKVHDNVEINENELTGMKLYSHQLERIGASGSYINSREVTKRFKVRPGYYLIIPSTYDANQDCEFMLRIFTEMPVDTNMKSLDDPKDELDEEDVYIEPNEEDSNYKKYKSILNPKMYTRKITEWAKSSNFKVDYENNEIRFGDEKVQFRFHDGETKALDAKFGKYTFGIDYNKGFKFRYGKNKDNS